MDSSTLMKMLEPLSAAERIKLLAELAHKADPQYRIFGSKKQKYQFAPTVDISQVREFEEKNGFKLPDELVIFLTEVGNGGAGVDYGIYPLDRFEFDDAALSEGLTIFDREDVDEFYMSCIRKISEFGEDYGDDEALQIDRIGADITRGMLIIGTAGCTYDYFIMLSGCKKGMIGQLDWNMMEEYYDVPSMYDLTLFEWLEDHFSRIILGKTTDNGCFSQVDHFSEDTGFKKRTRFIPKDKRVNGE